MKQDANARWDPRGLIADALSLEGRHEAEYRAIFFDWAFGLTEPGAAREAAMALLAVYRTPENAAHTIIALLEEAASRSDTGAETPRRRGGQRGRRDA